MANTLFESLQQKLNEPSASPLVGQQDTVASALRAKSGKATSAGAPKASNLGEASALDQGNTALAQQGQAGALKALQVQQAAQGQAAATAGASADMASQRRAALAEEATRSQAAAEVTQVQGDLALGGLAANEKLKAEQIETAADSALRQLASERGMSVDNIFRDFASSKKELAFREDAAQLEQIGFTLALRDKTYLDELDRVGAERDLEDKLSYQDEMMRLQLGDEMDRLLTNLDAKRALGSSQREWNEYLAKLDADTAMQVAMAAISDESQRQVVTGAGNVAKTGVDAYYKYGDKSSTTTKKSLNEPASGSLAEGQQGPPVPSATKPYSNSGDFATVGGTGALG